jgi:hypothetical protein
MFDRISIHNLLFTGAAFAYIAVLDRLSKSGFEKNLTAGVGTILVLVIWSNWLRKRRARLAAFYPCCMGAFFILHLVEYGPESLGTFIGGAGFILGLVGLVSQLCLKTNEGEAD